MQQLRNYKSKKIIIEFLWRFSKVRVKASTRDVDQELRIVLTGGECLAFKISEQNFTIIFFHVAINKTVTQ